jgi:uncharacterized protein YndB with AHSA1/START domain
MFAKEYTGTSTARPDQVFTVLADPERWPEWNEGVRRLEMHDLTEVPDAGVSVRVRHELAPTDHGTRITYRCEVDGPHDVADAVGNAVSADFAEVISALAARAEEKE